MKNEKSNKLLELVDLMSWPSRYFEIGAFFIGFLLTVAFGVILVKLNPPIAPIYLNMVAIAFGLVVISSVVTLVYKRRKRYKQRMIEQFKEVSKTSPLVSGEAH
jgi:uncharacterized membrane protein (DUF485 family)